MRMVKAKEIDKHYDSWGDGNREYMMVRGKSINPIWGIIIIPSCILFYFIAAGLNSIINPYSWGLLQWPAIIGAVFGFILPLKIANRKKVKITFSKEGLGVKNKMYGWKNFGGFKLIDHGGSQRTATSISFSYGIERIDIPVGWYNKAIAMSVLKELGSLSHKYKQ